MWFYVLVFGLLAIFVVVAFAVTFVRRNRELRHEEEQHHTPHAVRHERKRERVQSRNARRKRK